MLNCFIYKSIAANYLKAFWDRHCPYGFNCAFETSIFNSSAWKWARILLLSSLFCSDFWQAPNNVYVCFFSFFLSFFLSLFPKVPFFLFIIFTVYTMLPFGMRGAVIISVLSALSHIIVLSIMVSMTSQENKESILFQVRKYYLVK